MTAIVLAVSESAWDPTGIRLGLTGKVLAVTGTILEETWSNRAQTGSDRESLWA